jgi:flavin-dependent dehydrogenase
MTAVYDCLVLGGGPAGSTVAALVAEAGYRTLVLERDRFPRFHVGESLLPEAYWTLKRLGVLERMQASRFPRKYSVQFVSHAGGESLPLYYFDADPRECSQTWQVVRSEFDQMLLENAVAKGAECRQGLRVADVLFDGQRAVGVLAERSADDGAGGTGASGRAGVEELRGKVLVDATGQQSLIATRLGLREVNPRQRHASIWTYYRGARRDPGIDGGATLVLHTNDRRAWFWCIPLCDGVTSVGVVGEADYLLRGRGRPEAVFEEELCKCPAVTERLIDASLAGEFHVLKDFSYRSRQAAGDGWVLVGDAFGYVDPIHSSGVLLALKSGELAADAITEGLARGDTSAAQLGRWAAGFAASLDSIGRLVDAFYRRDFCVRQFVRQHPQHKRELMGLLMGKVFCPPVGEMWEALDGWRHDGDVAAPAPAARTAVGE